MVLKDAVFSIVCYVLVFVIFIKCFLKLTIRPCRSEKCLLGKTALVTGGNKGIGFQTSLGLATRGCRVIIACRSNADQVKHEIIRRTHNPNIVTKHLDLGSLESVRQFSKEIHETEEKFDILVNNAGIGVDRNVFTRDGLHPTMQINLFGPFLLTHLLLDLLKKAGSARIIFVSSITSYVNNLTLDNLNAEEGELLPFWDTFRIYANSKVGEIIVSHEFAERLKPYGITSNALHPGAIRTEIYDNLERFSFMTTLSRISFWVVKQVFFRSPEDGAQRTLTLAVSSSYENVTGTFLGLLGLSPAVTKNIGFRREVWSKIEEYVNLAEEEKIGLP